MVEKYRKKSDKKKKEYDTAAWEANSQDYTQYSKTNAYRVVRI